MSIRNHNEQPYLVIDTDQMIEVDRLMIEEYQITLIQMMENAGRCLAILARDTFLGGDPEGKRVCVLAGTGGNGGGALVGARRLSNWGANVDIIVTADVEKFTPVPKHQYKILKRMGLQTTTIEEVADAKFDLIIDGIIGYSVKGNPYGTAKDMIDWANGQPAPVLSLDTPSGLDLTSGKVNPPSVKADATLTLGMPKKGLFTEEAKQIVGELYVGDISIPTQLYSEASLGLEAQNLFRYSDIVKIG